MSPGLMGQRSALHYSCTPSSSARLLFLPPSIPAPVPLCGRSYESVLARGLARRGEQKKTSNQSTNDLMNGTPLTFSQGTRRKLKIRGKINPNIPNSAQSSRSHTARKTKLVCGEKRRGFGFQRRSCISVGSEQRQEGTTSLRNDKHKKHIP